MKFSQSGKDSSRSQIDFINEYQTELSAYLAGQADEEALLRAYELGRQGAARQLGILDLSEIHQAAMQAAAGIDVPTREGRQIETIIARSTEFFSQVLATFDMMYRGYGETIAQLQSLNAALNQHSHALQRSEERLRLFIWHTPAAVAILDKDLRYLQYSARWLSDYRLGDRDLTGLSHYEVFPEIPPHWREIFQRCLEGAVNKCEEAQFLRADGSADYVRWEIHPWYTDHQEVGGLIMFTEVITDRKNQERKIVRLSRIRGIMSAINAAIIRIADRSVLIREICRIAVEHGQFRMAWLGYAEHGTTAFTSVASVQRVGASSSVAVSPADIPDASGLVARAIKSGKTILCNNIAHDRRISHKEEYLKRGYHSLVMLPLFALEQPAGVLTLCAGEHNFFDQEEMKLLREIADDISFAFDHLAKEEKINYLAYYDALTDLPNRALFFDRLQRHIEVARRDAQLLVVILIDFDRFSNINDSYGRHVGDALLKEAARRMKNRVASENTLSHVGADRFALLLTNVVSAADAAHILERLLEDCYGPAFQLDSDEQYVSVKAGIAMFPSDGSEYDAIYKNAEIALRKAKKSDEAYLFYRPGMNASVAKRLTLENRLYRALEREEFTLYYQPKILAATGRIVGMESLLRWNEPHSGVVQPSAFIPILEETGMILPVGQWIMERAIADYRHWSDRGLTPLPIAVNVSVIQLRQRNFIDMLKKIHGSIPEGAHILDLEITESMLMEDIEQNIKKLQAAREMGMKIAIDDFGTGYSSLSYLTRLPIDLLKIDRSFILGMNESASGLAIVSSIISLAHSIEMQVVAEGVEEEDQRKLLKLLSCDQLQGYLYSKPLPVNEMEALLH